MSTVSRRLPHKESRCKMQHFPVGFETFNLNSLLFQLKLREQEDSALCLLVGLPPPPQVVQRLLEKREKELLKNQDRAQNNAVLIHSDGMNELSSAFLTVAHPEPNNCHMVFSRGTLCHKKRISGGLLFSMPFSSRILIGLIG
eukprot:g63868.t1